MLAGGDALVYSVVEAVVAPLADLREDAATESGGGEGRTNDWEDGGICCFHIKPFPLPHDISSIYTY